MISAPFCNVTGEMPPSSTALTVSAYGSSNLSRIDTVTQKRVTFFQIVGRDEGNVSSARDDRFYLSPVFAKVDGGASKWLACLGG